MGVLVELRDKNPMRFRCHTGHGFTAATLRDALNASSEDALWTAIRVLQERAMLMAHMARHARAGGQNVIAEQWDEEAHMAKSTAEQLPGGRDPASGRMTRRHWKSCLSTIDLVSCS
jgi:two-component system chemotaxis response regulator CheB